MGKNFPINTTSLHFIGYSVGIHSSTITVRIPHYSNLNKYMINNVPYNFTSINTFVLIVSNNYFFVGKVIGEDMTEHDTKELINEFNNDKSEEPELRIRILSEINPVNRQFIKITHRFPVINSKVYLADQELINAIITNISMGNSNDTEHMMTDCFAKLSRNHDIPINFLFKDLFNEHLGIVGSTGSGKSYTAAKLLLELINKNQHVVLLDPTGEYKSIIESIENTKFGDCKKVSVNSFDIGNGTYIPYCDLNDNELYKLVRPSNGIQFPKLKTSIKLLKFMSSYSHKNKEIDNFIDTQRGIVKLISNNHVKVNSLNKYINSLFNNSEITESFNFAKLPMQIKQECYGISTRFSNEGSMYLDMRTWGNCAPLADRITSFVGNKHLSRYFCNSLNDDNNFHKALTYNSVRKYSITYIDLEHVTVANSISEIIGDYIARKLLLSFINNNEENGKNSPVVLFLDEAHNFIKKDKKEDYFNLNYFNLIAKEGRKYGLFMTLITQSPYDLSRGVLTQFGTFIIQHLSNENEREKITSVLPYNSDLDKFISSLNTGEAIINSNNLYQPLMIKINKPSITPNSHTPGFH